MKSLLLFLVLMSSAFGKNCDYEASNACGADAYCVNLDVDKTGCQPHYTLPLQIIPFPFSTSVKVACDQGPLSPTGNTHSWLNTAFALDLQSDRSLKEVEILAGAKGKVIVVNDCKTENDQCGLGFGNSVKILHEDGHLFFYAHLKKVSVKTGDQVSIGDKIGIEGTTGSTGIKNRQLHLSLHYDWRSSGFEYWKNVGYLPPSVPFKMDCKNIKCKRSSVANICNN